VTEYVNAEPAKTFFLDMLTRDISLEDSVLDLIDNCIDALARTRNIDLDESLLDQKAVNRMTKNLREEGLPVVEITFDETQFTISDHCGGIEYDSAVNEVFRFGRVTESGNSRLSVYGIGLKRAIFKIGRVIAIESKTAESGFRVEIDADKWKREDEWHFPITKIGSARTEHSAGTVIAVSKLNKEVRQRIGDGIFAGSLIDAIASAYALFLDRFVIVKVNGRRVPPKAIPLGMSNKVTPAHDTMKSGHVGITLLAGLAERVDGGWKTDRAGWYVFCNGRVVVFADRGELTGWGINSPQYVSKYSGFVGLAFFFADDPAMLPWTTTKRGLNRESQPYLLARNRMGVLAKPVLGFLSSMYPSGDPEEPEERAIAQGVKAATISAAISGSGTIFKVLRTLTPSPASSTTTINYKVKRRDLDIVKKYIDKEWSASKIGHHTFQYFLERECGK
jgi:hypothetical protein